MRNETITNLQTELSTLKNEAVKYLTSEDKGPRRIVITNGRRIYDPETI